jgi:hypothetical protein
MRTLLIFIFIVSLTVFWLQNPQVIALFFFGSLVPLELSLGSWVVVFVLLGLLTGILVQILGRGSAFFYNRQRKQNTQSPVQKNEKFSDDNFYRESGWKSKDIDDDWEIEKPPISQTSFKTGYDNLDQTSPSKEESVQELPKDFTQSAKKIISEESQEKTIPTYPSKSSNRRRLQGNNIDDIYDAKYRVINPPSQDLTDKEENTKDEEWI